MSATSMFESCFTHQFKLSYSGTENVPLGHRVSSEEISAGGHLWQFDCYPRGLKRIENNGEYLSIFLRRVSKSKDNVEAVLEALVMDRDGALSSDDRKKAVHVYPPPWISGDFTDWGWSEFVKRSVLHSLYVTSGSFIIMCGAKLVRNQLLDVPRSDIGSHLGLLLDSGDGSDVSFVVNGEEFPAHRAVLAARSPVFKAQLLGSMADAKMSSITMLDITPETFRAMLRFMYTDACPTDAELGDDSPSEMFQNLLAAADRFALDGLKLLCAKNLWDNVSVETVADTLACAETYNCPELKKKCIEFFVEENNFKKAVLTDGFVQLGQKFPSILAELRKKVGA